MQVQTIFDYFTQEFLAAPQTEHLEQSSVTERCAGLAIPCLGESVLHLGVTDDSRPRGPEPCHYPSLS